MTDSSKPRRTQTSSPHLVDHYEVVEIEDILCFRFYGNYTLQIATELHERMSEAARRGYLLLLLDVGKMNTVTREARRYLVGKRRLEQKETAVAIIGASFALRTFMTMLIRAVSTLTKIPAALNFFETEEQALGWLRQERNRLRTAVAAD